MVKDAAEFRLQNELQLLNETSAEARKVAPRCAWKCASNIEHDTVTRNIRLATFIFLHYRPKVPREACRKAETKQPRNINFDSHAKCARMERANRQ